MSTPCLLLLVACSIAPAEAQEAPPAGDPWAPVRFLVGEWEGTAQGEPGSGKVERSYGFVLEGRYIQEKNVTHYPPQEKNPKGERHEHWSFLSYDRARKLLVLRQFHQEGFVNQYVSNREPGPALVFESERFENLPEDWKARESYRVLSADEFVETFEIASPGKPYSVYSRSQLRRVKPASR